MQDTKPKMTFKEFMKKFFYSYIWLMVLIFVADIVTKWCIAKHFNFDDSFAKANEIQIIPNFLYISLGYNDGMAWSLFAGTTGKIILACLSGILGTAFIVYYVKSYNKLTSLYKVPFALIIAGTFGNFIDRAFYWNGTVGFQGVIDWIQVYFGTVDPAHSFPTFNIADSALVVGVIAFIVVLIIEAAKDSKKAAKEGKYKYSPKELKEAEEAKKNEKNQDK